MTWRMIWMWWYYDIYIKQVNDLLIWFSNCLGLIRLLSNIGSSTGLGTSGRFVRFWGRIMRHWSINLPNFGNGSLCFLHCSNMKDNMVVAGWLVISSCKGFFPNVFPTKRVLSLKINVFHLISCHGFWRPCWFPKALFTQCALLFSHGLAREPVITRSDRMRPASTDNGQVWFGSAALRLQWLHWLSQNHAWPTTFQRGDLVLLQHLHL